MKRKTIVILAALLSAAAITLAGCGTGTDAGNQSESSIGEQTSSVAAETSGTQESAGEESAAGVTDEMRAIAGTWQIVENTIGDQKLEDIPLSVYVFNEDGTFEMLLDGDSLGQGTYTVDGDTVTIELNGEKTDLKLKGDQIVLEVQTSDGTSVSVYERGKN